MNKKTKGLLTKAYSILTVFMLLTSNFMPLLYTLPSKAIAQESEVTPTEQIVEEVTTPEVVQPVTPVVEEVPAPVVEEPKEETPAPVVQEEVKEPTPVVEEPKEETTQPKIVEVTVADSGVGALDTVVENVLYVCNATSTVSCVTTDKADYAPTDLVKVSGYGYNANTEYELVIYSNDDPVVRHEAIVKTNGSGDFKYEYQLDGNYRPQYYIEVHLADLLVVTGSFTDSKPVVVAAAPGGGGNPSADLDQCGNGSVLSPDLTPCQNNNEWVNGNLNESKSHYYEGDSVPYRLKFDNLTLGTHTVVIEWDTTKGGAHALDYITTYDRTVNADPCVEITGCGSPSTFPIPVDPQVSGAGVTQIPGVFTLFGGTITGVSAYSYPVGAGFTGDKSAQLTITFTASQDNPVLAWAGHIATRSDWGQLNSAVSIPGSPYHTRLIDLDGSGGNQDRSLSAAAVIFPASITIIKQANVEGSTSFPFTASPLPLSNFNLVDNGTSANTIVFDDITDFQTYTVTEGTNSLWTLQSVVCTVTSANGGSQSVNGSTATIDLEEGENVTCTYNNNVNYADLTVVKNVVNDNGGNATVSAFDIRMNNNALTFGTGNTVGTTTTYTSTPAVVANTQYTLSENTNVSGYVAGTWSCVDNNTDLPVSHPVTLSSAQSVTCTITNNDIAPSLTVVKNVVNDNGGNAVVGDFDININGGSELAFGTGVVNGTSTTYSTVAMTMNSNISYMLDENTQFPGYTAGNWSCIDNNNAEVEVTNPVTLNEGQSVTCTITNNDIAPSLTVIKNVVNDDGGNAIVADFEIKSNNSLLTFGAGNTVGETTTYTSTPSVTSNTQYTLTENTNVAGYVAGTWSCVDNNTQETVSNPVTLSEGQNVTCTISNNDVTPTLTVIKNVINDNGGNAVVADFEIKSNNNLLTFGTGNTVGSTTTYTSTPDVDSNTVYDLTEKTDVAGYVAGTWSCVDNNTQETVSNPVTLSEGQNVTCTISNNDVAPTLTVVKNIVNDDGGDAVIGDFEIKMNNALLSFGTGNTSDSTTTHTSTPTVVANTQYELTEKTDVAGYVAGTWSCVDNNTQQTVSNPVTLSEGQNVTCTVTNNDIKPGLTVIKNVVNDNGGNAVVADFEIEMNESSIEFDGGITTGSTTTYTSNPTVVSNTQYELTENTNVAGYVAGTWVCVDNNTQVTVSNPVTLSEGQNVVCTITNNDIAPTLTVIKEVVNDDGGTAVVTDFEIKLNNDLLVFGEGITVLDTTTYTSNPVVLANTQYTVSEKQDLAGYIAGDWSCIDNDTKQTVSNPLTLNEGQNVTCTVVNNDIAPELTVIKNVVNDNGGSATVEDFDIELNGENLVFGSSETNEDTTSYTSNPDVVANTTYTLSEDTDVDYYEAGTWVCVDTQTRERVEVGTVSEVDGQYTLELELGQKVECEITNNDVEPRLEIEKINDAVGNKEAGDQVRYTITVKVLESAVHNLLVTDFLPNTFEFITGSSVVKVGASVKSVSEPTYSDGTAEWNLESLGNLVPGDIVTISYLGLVTTDTDPGLYKDIAWAVADSGTENIIEEIVYDFTLADHEVPVAVYALATGAGALEECNPEDCGNFVGTEVNIVETNIEEAGVVLGTRTVELPNTGMNPIILIASIISMISGIVLVLFSFGMSIKRSKKLASNVLALVIGVGVFASLSSSTNAASSTILRVETPAATANTAFNVGYTVADLKNRKVIVTCDVVKPNTTTVTTNYEYNEGKGSGSCVVDLPMLTEDGVYKVTVSYDTYENAVIVSSGSNASYTVKYDTVKPGTPTNFSKTEVACKYDVAFKTSNDGGQTVKVEIFRSTEKSFNADASTLVETMVAGSNQSKVFENGKPNCDTTYYYAVRAVDEAGNTSDFVGDTIVVTQVVNVPGENNNNNGGNTGNDNNGEVEGETDTPKNNDGDNGEVKGDDDKTDGSDVEGATDKDNEGILNGGSWTTVLAWIGGILLGIIIVWQLVQRGIVQKVFQKIVKR